MSPQDDWTGLPFDGDGAREAMAPLDDERVDVISGIHATSYSTRRRPLLWRIRGESEQRQRQLRLSCVGS